METPIITGTIDLMVWLRDNECPELFNEVFSDNLGPILMVSTITDETFKKQIDITMDELPHKEYQGMCRWHDGHGGWLIRIHEDKGYYFASVY